MKNWRYLSIGLALIGLAYATAAADAIPSGQSGTNLRIGIIGVDTSHASAFTKILNDTSLSNHIAGGTVVAFYKGGSQDIPESAGRVEKIASELLDKYHLKQVQSVEELCQMVDVVLLESLDGRPHLEQVRPVIAAGKTVFIDKPVAGSLKDVIEIDRLAKEKHVPWFSSSAYRYYDCMVDLKKKPVGEIRGALSYGPCELEPHHPDLFWYGIHATEALFTVMGPGCESVVRTSTKNTDEVTGVWAGGKVGTLRGIRNGASAHKVIVFGSKAIAEQEGDGDYVPLVKQIMHFFQTGIAPVPNEETIQIYAFMEAADESKRQGGKPVKLSDVMKNNGG